MKKKLNLKIEEVKINKNLQSSGMFGGPCDGGGAGVAGNLSSSGFTANTVGGYINSGGVACGGCHGIASEGGRDAGHALATGAAATAGALTGGLPGAVGMGGIVGGFR
jgi:hypothetical protein